MRLRNVGAYFVMIGLVWAGDARASECDQYFGRLKPLKDSAEPVNARINRSLQRVVDEWDGKRDDYEFAKSVRNSVDGSFMFARFSSWLEKSDEIDRMNMRRTGMYAEVPPCRSIIPMFQWWTIKSTVRVGDTLLGADKFSHMLSVGWDYYKVYRRKGMSRTLKYGRDTEDGTLGLLFTGVFSNADLVANYEGLLFYIGLSTDGVVSGKPALIAWDGDKPRLQRAFDILDHVNAYWDESINTNVFRSCLERRVGARIKRLICPKYAAQPEAYDLEEGKDLLLELRYRDLGLREHRDFRLSRLCSDGQ